MLNFIDQMGHKVQLSAYPKRIISLVPSFTELLFDLGLDREVVGVTQYCVFPKNKVDLRTKIGGPKEFDFSLIDALKPDLIIGDKEENYAEGIHQLQQKYPLWVSNIRSIDDAFNMIKDIGKLVNRQEESEYLIKIIDVGLNSLPNQPVVKTAYLIWKNPYMAVGRDTFIHAMLERCGFINIFSNKQRYPKIHLDELKDSEVILLSSEPYSFTREDIEFFRTRYPDHLVSFVDGTIFSWYGSHMQYAPAYIKSFREKLFSNILKKT